MFLHAEPFHLFGNMLALWVFGPPVEDRLGPGLFLVVYLLTGIVGDCAQAALGAMAGSHLPGIGASGCIMGILGAYWFTFPWSTVCVFYWFFIVWAGTWQIKAIYVIGAYFCLDLLNGMIGRAAGQAGGVANFAHVGGAAAGALMCLALKVRRDNVELSDAKAVQADPKDLSLLPLDVLETMIEQDAGNPEILRALAGPAIGKNKRSVLDKAVAVAGPALVDKDPFFVAHYLMELRGGAGLYQPVHLLRLAGMLDRAARPDLAIAIYQMILSVHAGCPDCESALFRMARCYWDRYKNGESAKSCPRDMASRFPNGAMTPFGRTLWNDITGRPS